MSVCVVAIVARFVDAQPFLEQIQPGVVRITAEDSQSRPIGSASGFIVEHEGRLLVVTNFQAMRDSNGATARLAIGDPEPVKLEPLAAHPGRDFAIFRLAEPGALRNQGARGLRLSTTVDLGDRVWMCGFRTGPGITAEGGEIGRLLARHDEPYLIESGIARGVTRLIMSDVKITEDNAGGPLVNIRGEVIGVGSLVLSDDTGVSTALSSLHLEEVFKDLPAESVGFDLFRMDDAPARPGPRPGRAKASGAPSTLLVSAAASLRRGIICNRCGGTGWVEQKKQTGTKREGPNTTRPVFEMVPVDCTTCRATRVQRPPAIRTQLSRVVEALAEVEEDEKYEERLMALRDMLRDRVAPVAEPLHPVLFDWYRDIVRKPQDQQIGEILVAFGGVEDMIDHETFWIRQSTAGPIMVRDTRLVHTLDREHVIIAGYISGFEKHRGKDTFVLRRGLVVSY